jgi:hypothetical protein
MMVINSININKANNYPSQDTHRKDLCCTTTPHRIFIEKICAAQLPLTGYSLKRSVLHNHLSQLPFISNH